ncbi:MAG: hypothetical protein ACRDRU_27125 [Pseudonocardiaceae bacterium]
MRHRRLPRNVAQHAILPPVRTAEREPWTAAHAVAFLDYALRTGDRLANLFEVIIGTGLRRGEALALHWSDLDLGPGRCSSTRIGAPCPTSPDGSCSPHPR